MSYACLNNTEATLRVGIWYSSIWFIYIIHPAHNFEFYVLSATINSGGLSNVSLRKSATFRSSFSDHLELTEMSIVTTL